MKKKVTLRAPLLTNSGYGVHSRQLFEWLYAKDNIDLRVDCLRWGHTPWLVDPDYLDGLVGKIMSRAQPFEKNEIADVSYQVQLPNEWDPKLARRNIGISAFVETDRCNPAWIECCNKMDLVIAPSSFTKQVATTTGVIGKPFHVIPEWYNHALLSKANSDKIISKDKRFNFDTKFNILMMGLLTSADSESDRKNIVNTIVWILDAFKNNKDVGIILKTSFGKDGVQDRTMCEEFIGQIVKAHRKSEYPKIHLVHGNLSQQELAALYHHGDTKVFVSATRGEGYGLPLIDAAVAGVPIVTTGYSGQFEFLDRELVSCIDYTLSDIPKNRLDGHIFLEGFRWAQPSKDSFQKLIKEIYEDHSLAKQKANKLKKIVSQKFHKTAIFKKYDELTWE